MQFSDLLTTAAVALAFVPSTVVASDVTRLVKPIPRIIGPCEVKVLKAGVSQHLAYFKMGRETTKTFFVPVPGGSTYLFELRTTYDCTATILRWTMPRDYGVLVSTLSAREYWALMEGHPGAKVSKDWNPSDWKPSQGLE
ncbi:hypothetical protein MCOR25_002145 [Pyricularia grisea]|uniref:Uncharacterized protein n=1 Tax=Pyricularia grisea TaxID=148305 RepID=A0A6P8B9L2_PYRGI|nr:uncharacterized protein PgNI_02925 [Pyricularia grisea]KAI6378724.1 hypothetical protein MCOR25_002145 [Pyricularia grisea]TLD12357.1 hypothetical protein PgNI_02925 [Pyricularia grisea]